MGVAVVRGWPPPNTYALQSAALEYGEALSGGGEAAVSRLWGFTSAATASGVLYLTAFTAAITETIAHMAVTTGNAAAGATPTLCRFGLYTVAADGSIALVASIPNDTTLFAVPNTRYSRALSAPLAKVAGTRYAGGVLVVSAAAMPQYVGGSTPTTGGFTVAKEAPWRYAQVGGQADLPAAVAAGSVVASTAAVQFEALP